MLKIIWWRDSRKDSCIAEIPTIYINLWVIRGPFFTSLTHSLSISFSLCLSISRLVLPFVSAIWATIYTFPILSITYPSSRPEITFLRCSYVGENLSSTVTFYDVLFLVGLNSCFHKPLLFNNSYYIYVVVILHENYVIFVICTLLVKKLSRH